MKPFRHQAGRGALIGPMVIACVCIEKKDEKKLKAIGVKDSKALTPEKREELAKYIEDIAKDIVILRIPACKILSYRKEYKMKLDELEALKVAQIIEMVNAKKFYIDSLGNVEEGKGKFEENIRKNLRRKDVELIVENYADETYPVVSAASIIAKVERDKEIEKLKKEVGFDFGVGYSHDERTIKFLEKILLEYDKKPNFVRWHWNTVENLAEKLWKEGKNLKPWVKKEILKGKRWQMMIKDFFKKKK